MAQSNNYVPLPAVFVETVAAGVPGLAESLDSEVPVSVRCNPYKPYLLPASAVSELVPWTEKGEACYLTERPVFTTDPGFHGGAYYVQEAGSMFVGWLLRRILPELNALSPRVLDLCAAPGGKTTHIASVLGSGGVVVANEVIRSRARILAENVQKWGSGNIAVTSNDPADFGERLPGFFDAIVVDAPCSGEGMFRKDYGARAEWSPENVRLCAARQRRIVSDVWDALRPAGVMIYSTCTFNTEEDEENARWIADELGGEIMEFERVPEGIVPGFSGGRMAGWHFYPHKVRSEGFFAVAIRKSGTAVHTGKPKAGKGLALLSKNEMNEAARWIESGNGVEYFATGGDGMVYGFSPALYGTVSALLNRRFGLLYSGVQLGEMIRGGLKPAHALALYHGLNRTAVLVAELPDEGAMEYLRKGTSTSLLPVSFFADGLNLVSCRGIALGWAKRIGNRCNNLYPSSWRVLNY